MTASLCYCSFVVWQSKNTRTNRDTDSTLRHTKNMISYTKATIKVESNQTPQGVKPVLGRWTITLCLISLTNFQSLSALRVLTFAKVRRKCQDMWRPPSPSGEEDQPWAPRPLLLKSSKWHPVRQNLAVLHPDLPLGYPRVWVRDLFIKVMTFMEGLHSLLWWWTLFVGGGLCL